MKKQFVLFIILINFYCYSFAQTNTWNGSTNQYWHNYANWSLGHIPLSTEDVVITTSGYTCFAEYFDEECNSLTVNSGATLIIADPKITVNGDVNISGDLQLSNTPSELACLNIYWLSGSSGSMTGNATIYVEGTWEFANGSNVYLTGGYVNFEGAGNSFIRSNDADSYFNHIRNYKSSGYLGHSGVSAYPLDINGNIYCYSNTQLQSFTTQPIELAGFINNMSGHIYMNAGTFKFDGGSSTNQFMAGDYFNHLTVASSGTTTFADDIEIKGNLRIESGILSPGVNTISVGGNWENVVGPAAFFESTSRVVFNGYADQYCNYDENFNLLEVNKSAGELRVNNATAELFCDIYDWTSGAVNVLQGTFTADDLADDGIEGSWYVNEGALVNLTNMVGYVDLLGDVHILGGTMNVYGGEDDSYWPYDEEASIEIWNGTLLFHDVGIYIQNAGILNEILTWGTIGMAGNFRVNRTDFTQGSGDFVMLGSTDTYVQVDDGYIAELNIEKTDSFGKFSLIDNPDKKNPLQANPIYPDLCLPPISKNIVLNQTGIYLTGFKGRDGKTYTPAKSNTVKLNSDVTTVARLILGSGTFDMNGHQAILTGNMLITDDGVLKMTNINDHLNTGIINWYAFSSANITAGLIEVRGNWGYLSGTNCQIGPGNMVTFIEGSGPNGIFNYDADAHFGSVTIDNNIYIDEESYHSVKISGDLIVNTGNTLNIQDETLIVDGAIDILDGGKIQDYQASGGTLENNSDFLLNGELDVGPGDVMIHGEFDIASTGTLSIDGGSFVYDSGTETNNISGTLNISDGLYQAKEQIIIFPTASTNITGGSIKTLSLRAENTGTFQPTGGTVEIQTNNNSLGYIYCSNGNYFHNLKINPLISLSGGGKLQTDILVQNNLEITEGMLEFNGNEVTVNNDVFIYDRLKMDDSNDILNAGDSFGDQIIWKTGSDCGSVNAGAINIFGSWTFENGTNGQIGIGNTVTFANSGGVNSIHNYDADVHFGSVIIDRYLYIDGVSTESVKISGDLTVTPGNTFNTQNQELVVDGTINIADGGKIQMYQAGSGGYLENNSDFVLNGILDVGNGNAMVHGEFDIAATGELTIDGGSFIYDSGLEYNNIFGTLNLSDGLYQSSETVNISSSATTNISGGLIRTKGIVAENTGTFEPTGGTVEIHTTNSSEGVIYCSNGNFLYNLKINPLNFNQGGGKLNTDVLVQNDLEITGGYLRINGYELTVNNDITVFNSILMDNPADILNAGNSFGDQILWKTGSSCNSITSGIINVFGDWTFENGTNGQMGTGNTVNFYGNNNSTIFNADPDVEFGNMIINKTAASHYIVTVPSGTSVRIAEDLNITDGELKLNGSTGLYVQNELNVHNGGILSTIATSGNESTVSGYPGYGIFEVMNGGTISAEYTTFEYFEGAGVVVANGAIIDPTHPFTNCSFTEGTSGGTLLTINNNQTLTIDGANFPNNTWTGTYNVGKTINQGEITFTNCSGGFSGSANENDPYNKIFWHPDDFLLNVRLYLEGPFNSTTGLMLPTLNNSGSIPISQPYNTAPWNYSGTESVGSVPSSAIDWVLIELRDAADAISATPSTTILRKVVFVKNNGYLVDLDGSSFPQVNISVSQNLFIVILHRNHLSIMSAYPLVESGGVYVYDFRTASDKAYGGIAGHKQLLPSGYWGLIGGDANRDGEIGPADKIEWSKNVGENGYQGADLNLDSQINNKDKNNIWHFNLGKESQVPN